VVESEYRDLQVPSHCRLCYSSKHKGLWHLKWQNICKADNVEVIMKENDKIKHIADVENENKLVIELQDSNISGEDVENRESFYNDMIWIIQLKEKRCKIILNLENESDKKQYLFIKPTITFHTLMKKPVYFDTVYGLLRPIITFKNNSYICEIVSMKEFLVEKFNNILVGTVDDTVKILCDDMESDEFGNNQEDVIIEQINGMHVIEMYLQKGSDIYKKLKKDFEFIILDNCECNNYFGKCFMCQDIFSYPIENEEKKQERLKIKEEIERTKQEIEKEKREKYEKSRKQEMERRNREREKRQQKERKCYNCEKSIISDMSMCELCIDDYDM
jgi:hypothetical protein